MSAPDTHDVCRAQYQWTRDELARAMRHHYRLQVGSAIFWKTFAVIPLAIAGVAVGAWVFISPDSPPPPAGGLFLLVVAGLYLLARARLNAWRSTLGFSKRPDADTQITWQLSPDEIIIDTKLGKSIVSWKSFVKIVETNDGFLFYPLKNLFHWLPFSACESPDCVERIRELVAQNSP